MFKIRSLFVVLLLLVGTITGQYAFAQANIVENETNILYVNGATGNDKNAGTQAAPFATIQAAVTNAFAANKKGIGTNIQVAPGNYPEDLQINSYGNGSGKTSAPLTIQATTPGTVILDGADVITGWEAYDANAFAAPWTDAVSGCTLSSGWPTDLPSIILANEMVFVNGQPLTEVQTKSQLHQGTFMVSAATGQLVVYPFSGTNMQTAVVEATERQQVLHLLGSRNVVLRGLAFDRAASCLNVEGALIASSSNILLDNVQANWNNWGGIEITGTTNFTMQNSTTSFNGGLGVMGYEVQSGLFLNDEADYNDWRGAQAGFYDFGQGGVKFGRSHGVTVTGMIAYNNLAEGLWFDTDNMNVTVNNAVLVGNLVDNLKLEANEGPFTVQSNVLCNGGVGTLLIDSAGVTMTGNYLYGNGSYQGNLLHDQNGQVYLAGNPGGRTYTNFQTGATVTTQNTNVTLTGNTFADSGASQYLFNTYLGGSDWSAFASTFQSNNNVWYDAANLSAITVPGGKAQTLPGWQNYTGQDSGSTWAPVAASSACTVPAPSYVDFALLARNAVNFVPSYSMVNGTVAIPLQVESFGYGDVGLSVTGLPAGVTAQFSQSTIVSGNLTLTLQASSAVPAQTASVVVFGTSKSRVHSLALTVNITPAS